MCAQALFMSPLKAFSAQFVKGKARGRLLGFPTINFDTSKIPEDLEFGVYRVEIFVDEKWYPGVAHYGPNSTFGDQKPTFEVHILKYERALSGARSGFVRIHEKIRDTKKFASKEELKKQIGKDIALIY